MHNDLSVEIIYQVDNITTEIIHEITIRWNNTPVQLNGNVLIKRFIKQVYCNHGFSKLF